MELASGYGSGYGSGDGYGYGSGDGYGYGYGDGDGYGYGYGSGDGYGYGYGDGDGYGYGDGYGDGYGYGYGSGDGYGSGYGYGKIHLPKSSAWRALHYIRKDAMGNFVLRNSTRVKPGEPLHEDEIILCEIGLHASFTEEDAKQYAPCHDAVLTEVLVWGDILVSKDKLVATDRMIVGEVCAQKGESQ